MLPKVELSVAARWLIGDKLALVLEFWIFSFIAVNTVFDLTTERSNQALHWPSGSITKSTDCMTFDLVGKLFKHVDLSEVSITEFHSLEHIHHPTSTLTAWSALAA